MSKPTVYFNDNEKFVCDWLANLYPEATVDCRSVTELSAMNPWLDEATRVHLFAGIGGWEYALQLAGWPDNLPVWTGSCPCQPFSTAGKRKGTEDARHLWPEMLRLVRKCRPPVIFGEQVASKDGRLWLAGVRADLEALGYAVGAADLCAAGVGAPHIRQRLYWVAYTGQSLLPSQEQLYLSEEDGERPASGISGCFCRDFIGLGESDGKGYAVGVRNNRNDAASSQQAPREAAQPTSAWSNFSLVYCLDGKTRRVGSGIQPLANGVSARVGKLRAAGNSIVPQVAAEFIAASMEVMGL